MKYLVKKYLCKVCKTKFESDSRPLNSLFCSDKCYGKYKSIAPKIPNKTLTKAERRKLKKIMLKKKRGDNAPLSIILAEEKPKHKLTSIDLWSDKNRDRWLSLRYKVFKHYGRKCMVCGSTDKLHVDHIKPKSIYPHLAFDFNNLQILCELCNIGKSNKFSDDWRQKP